LLLGESRHRIKNTIATVQALATQSLDPSDASRRDLFLARLQALGEAHDLLTMENWDRALLADVVDRALKPYTSNQANRISAQGPSLWIAANNSLMLTMCLHELATNAAKYGALSNGSGRVRVAWSESPGAGKVHLAWEESGGPPVAAPAHKGFGSRLIETSFGSEGATIEHGPGGLRCRLVICGNA
jgi:two-component sensor histidine kinase